MTLPRAIALPSVGNLRDLGGYATADGRRVRRGMVYRSAALGGLSATDAPGFAALGIRTICDFRGTAERARAPSPPGIGRIVALPIEPSVGASLRDLAATGQATGEDALAVMARAYGAYAANWTHRYRALFELLAEDAALPLLFHCSAGKDRTGFGAALLLRALGVDPAGVMADYLATNDLWTGDSALARELPPHMAAVLLRVHPTLLEAAFQAIDTRYGSFEVFLTEALGLDQAARSRLQDRLLEDA